MNDIGSSTRTLEISGQQVRVFEGGAGDPVLVLHGWGGRIESMAPTIECLIPKFRVLALDLPGFGESPLPTMVWGTPEYSSLVIGLLEELGHSSAHFVGHSYGAKVSLYLAATTPALVDKLVIVGASGLRGAPGIKTRLKRGASRLARATGSLGSPGRAVRDRVYRRLASRDYRDAGPLRPILVRVVNEDLGPMLPSIKAPTLLVWGSADDAVPLAHARRMERLIPGSGLVVFEGTGHFAYLDEPQRFCRVVRHFFDAPVMT